MGKGRADKMAVQDFIRNEKCFVRKELDCGRYFGVSKTCFIACPNSDEIGMELSIITDKLQKEGIEPFIAVKERVYGEDIFCTKICGKIIESCVMNDDAEEVIMRRRKMTYCRGPMLFSTEVRISQDFTSFFIAV